MYEDSTNPFVHPASTPSSGIDAVWPSNLNILSPPRVNLALYCDSSGPRGKLIPSRQHGNSMREALTCQLHPTREQWRRRKCWTGSEWSGLNGASILQRLWFTTSYLKGVSPKGRLWDKQCWPSSEDELDPKANDREFRRENDQYRIKYAKVPSVTHK